MTGTVKFFNESKGYGFITEDGSEKDHFVHVSGLIDEIGVAHPRPSTICLCMWHVALWPSQSPARAQTFITQPVP